MSENSENAALEAEKVQGAETAAAGAAGDQKNEEESLVLKFKKPYQFEGREYTAADLCAVAKLSGRDTGITPIPEMTIPYAIHMAARASKLPVEFFRGLPAQESMKLKNLVSGFLYGGDGEE